MEQRSIFFDEWIKSLREQYKYVIRNNDHVTLPSLTKVMHEVGFTDDELAQLRINATMHVDDVGTDYVPDMNVLDTPPAGQPHPAECTCPQCVPIDESQFDEDGQPLTEVDPEKETYETGHVFESVKFDQNDESDLDDDDTQTYEDTLTENGETDTDLEDMDSEQDEAGNDPDAPQQMSMF